MTQSTQKNFGFVRLFAFLTLLTILFFLEIRQGPSTLKATVLVMSFLVALEPLRLKKVSPIFLWSSFWKVLISLGWLLYLAAPNLSVLLRNPSLWSPNSWPLLILTIAAVFIVITLGFFIECLLLKHRLDIFYDKIKMKAALKSAVMGWSVLMIVILTNLIFSRVGYRLHLSKTNASMLSAETAETLASFSDPVEVMFFFSRTSEVRASLEDYASSLDQLPNVKAEFYDYYISPDIASRERITENGVIVLRTGKQSARMRIGQNLENALATLSQFDSAFLKKLSELNQKQVTVFVSDSFGEMKLEANNDAFRSLTDLYSLADQRGFYLKRFDWAQQGYSLPDEVKILLIASPTEPLDKRTQSAISEFIAKGGHLWLTLDPLSLDRPQAAKGSKPVDIAQSFSDLLQKVGVNFIPYPLANDTQHVTAFKTSIDKWFLFSNNWGEHPITMNVSRNAARSGFIFFNAGHFAIDASKGNASQPVAILKSLNDTFTDKNRNFILDKEEDSGIFPVGIAHQLSSGSRIVLLSSGTFLSNSLLSNKSNAILAVDILKWLSGNKTIATAVVGPEKVHFNNGDSQLWFYFSVAVFPLMVLLMGFFAMRLRERSIASITGGGEL